MAAKIALSATAAANQTHTGPGGSGERDITRRRRRCAPPVSAHSPDAPTRGAADLRRAARMERHVALLDSYRAERPEGGEVLRQPDRRQHGRELPRGTDAQERQRGPDSGMDSGRPAHGTDGEGKLDATDEPPLDDRPGGER